RIGSGPGAPVALFVLLGRPDTRDEDPDSLVRLAEGIIQLRRRLDQWHPMNQAERSLGLAEFLQAETKLVDEVARRFGGLCFAMVEKRRCAGANELFAEVPAGSGAGHFLHKPHD